jgi:vacuolar protein sorting-associated protein 16
LLALQEQLQKDTSESFIDHSVSETIFKLLLLDQLALAKKVVSDFNVSNNKFWWLQLRAFIAKHDWNKLEKVNVIFLSVSILFQSSFIIAMFYFFFFGHDLACQFSKMKSPIGFIPFVEECIKVQEFEEASKVN